MRILIEIDGKKLDITDDLIDPESVKLSLPRDIETLADGTRRLTGTGRISLEAKLTGQPMWGDV